jgi:hypothetical protein
MADIRGSYDCESYVLLSWVFWKRGGPGQRFGWVGMHVCHSRVDPRDASHWPWGITLGSQTRSLLSFHDRVSVRDIQDPIRRCDTKNQLIEGPGRQIRTGDAHIEDPGDRQLSFPEKIAQHKDAHQLKIELFESLKDVVGGGRGN